MERCRKIFRCEFSNGEKPAYSIVTGKQKYSKDDKVNLIHIAVCRLLEPFGFYEFEDYDDDGCPMYKQLEELPELKPNEQQLLMKKAIIQYFIDEDLLEIS